MKRAMVSLSVVLLAATLGFASDKDDKRGHETKQAKEVRETELAFAATARAKDYEKAMSFWDEDIHFFADGKMQTGIAAQRKNWEFLKNPDLTITWTPEVVEASGGLGYTTGPYEMRVKQKDGSEKVQHGRYVTIWRRKPNGTWKAAVDIGSAEPPPAQKP
jgi:ketosteroid isomerase-like protein